MAASIPRAILVLTAPVYCGFHVLTAPVYRGIDELTAPISCANVVLTTAPISRTYSPY
jgi:hypothetical protein